MMSSGTADISAQLRHLSTKPSEESPETSHQSGKPEDAAEGNDISSKPYDASVQGATAPSSKDRNNGLLDKEVMSSTKVNIKQSGDRYKRDKETPCIHGCCFMPGGELVLTDVMNDKIKVLHSSLVYKESLDMLNNPLDVAAFDASSVVVALGQVKQVQLIRVLPSLKKDRAISVGLDCRGVYVVDGRIYVLCQGGFKESEVRVYNADRKLLRKVDTSKYEFHIPHSIAVNKAQKLFFITDLRKITCLSRDGALHYQFGNEGGGRKYMPGGLYLDDNDNIIVGHDEAGEEINEVQFITASGKKHKTLLTHKDNKVSFRCVAYRPSDGTLAVGGAGSNHLFVYKLS